MNPNMYLRSRRAVVAFDVIGRDTDAVMAWQFEHPTVTIEPQYETYAPLDSFLYKTITTGYTLTIESYHARGIWIPRPTWMDEDLPDQPALNPGIPELEP